MKHMIETRFNVGDVIYIADHYYDYYASRTPYVVSGILIHINNKEARVLYDVKQGKLTDRFPEYLCFSTYEECAKWCERHNRIGGEI